MLHSLRFYWRINLAVMLAGSVGVAVLTGSLLVGDSLRDSLRDLAESCLGWVEQSLTSETFFREQLAHAVPDSVGAIALQGAVTHTSNGSRAARVQIWGVDNLFWQRARLNI